MSVSDRLRNEIIRSVLLKHAGTGDHRDVLAANEIRIWEYVIRKFTPLIGATSITLILHRSLDINKQVFPWLVAASTRHNPEDVCRDLIQSFERRHPADIVEANSALMITFAQILDILIGERLTTLYLLSALPQERLD
ncbi:MAG: hypothetical protein V4632_13110 [Pseudomonadota bacterium]